MSAGEFNTSGSHGYVHGDGAIDATKLTIRPYSGGPGAPVLTVDALGNVTAVAVIKGVQLESTGNMRAEGGIYAGAGLSPRKIADSSGCYYA